MKLVNVNNVEGLFKVLDSCEGAVYLVSKEGDRINLKSKLSQMLFTANLFTKATINELDLIVSEPEDMKKVVDFMMRGANVWFRFRNKRRGCTESSSLVHSLFFSVFIFLPLCLGCSGPLCQCWNIPHTI